MNRSYQAIYVLVALNVIVSLVFLSLMPDQVPGHFGANGLPSRMGSKYESLFIPAIAFVFGLGLVYTAKRCDEQERKTLVKADALLQLGVMAFIMWSSWTALTYQADASGTSNPGIAQGAAILGGILLIVSGNLMPKMNVNAWFGIRTPWSMSSPEAWRRTQRLGGRGCILVGAAMIACAFALDARLVTYAVLALLLALLGACMVGSHLAYRKESLAKLEDGQ